MSILIMSKVWAHSVSTGSERLILLAIADFADDDGRAYPSVTTLAKKARVSERTAQYAIRALVELGELAIYESKGPKGCNLYRVQNLREGCKMEQEGVQSTTKRGAMGCTRTVIEPSENLFAEPVGTAVETVKKPATQPRQPNPLLDALASVGGANPRETPPSRWSAIQKYLREIKSVTPDVTPEEIKRRERDYLRKYPNATVTPDALAKHWGALAQGHQPAGTRVQSIPALPEPPNWQAIIDREFPGSSFASAHCAGGRKWAAMSPGDQAAVAQAVKPYLA